MHFGTEVPSSGVGVKLFFSLRVFVCFWRDSPRWARASSFTTFLDHTQRRTTVGRASLDEKPLPDNTQHSQQTNVHAPGGIRTYNLSRRAAADLRLRPRCHCRILRKITDYWARVTVHRERRVKRQKPTRCN